MIGIDTNVLVRFLVRDDEAQFEKARRLIGREVSGEEEVFVSLLVLAETEWVLRSRYRMAKREIVEAISALLDARDVRFEDEPAVEVAVYTWKDGMADFADCLIGAHSRSMGCRAVATFDAKAARLEGFVRA